MKDCNSTACYFSLSQMNEFFISSELIHSISITCFSLPQLVILPQYVIVYSSKVDEFFTTLHYQVENYAGRNQALRTVCEFVIIAGVPNELPSETQRYRLKTLREIEKCILGLSFPVTTPALFLTLSVHHISSLLYSSETLFCSHAPQFGA